MPHAEASDPPAERINHFRAGRGKPLVLIHGIGSRWQIWEPVLPCLREHREVIAIDLPGFGASPKPAPGTRAGASALTDLVAAFLARLGIERPHVAGNSLGGWIALELARRGEARSVTALSPAGFYTEAEAAFMRGSLAAARRAIRALGGRGDPLVGWAGTRHLLVWQLVAHGERIPPQALLEDLRVLSDAPWFEETIDAMVAERFFSGRMIDVPATIAWGEHDRLLLRRQAHRAAEQIPHARVLTLRGCGHVPMYDDPVQVAQVLLEGSAARP